MKRRDFVKLISTAGIASLTGSCLAGTAKKSLPKAADKGKVNFLFILADDVTYNDLGCLSWLTISVMAIWDVLAAKMSRLRISTGWRARGFDSTGPTVLCQCAPRFAENFTPVSTRFAMA